MAERKTKTIVMEDGREFKDEGNVPYYISESGILYVYVPKSLSSWGYSAVGKVKEAVEK